MVSILISSEQTQHLRLTSVDINISGSVSADRHTNVNAIAAQFEPILFIPAGALKASIHSASIPV
jgi:hypothetical protein